jgi:parallel beta-helix repeat protein
LLLSGHLRRAQSTRSTLLAGACVIVSLACLAAEPTGANAAPSTCNKFASPLGSDAGNGSAGAPLRSAQALADALAPGEVGCLEAGTYGGGVSFEHGGTPTAPIVLRSNPGEQALLTGRIYVERGSDYVTVADVSLDGNFQSSEGSEPLPSPTVDANHATFEGDDVTNDNTGICFDLGNEHWGSADSTLIAEDHIHNCGALPATNQDHGIYVAVATNTRIVGNLINRNADRGIQLYPGSEGAVIIGNVISENGEGVIFSGDDGVASSDNVVEHNLIVNSLIRSDIESWYPAGNPLGAGNVAAHNCVSSRGVALAGGGFSAFSNVTASPAELLAGANGAVQPVTGSPCAAAVGTGGGLAFAFARRVTHSVHARHRAKPSRHRAKAARRGTAHSASARAARLQRRMRSHAGVRRSHRSVGESFSRKRSSSSTR